MKKSNKTVIGAFVVGAIVLLVIAILVFGSGVLFSQSDKYVVFFNDSVKGLSVGAPVIFKGVQIGNISKINIVYNKEIQDILIIVIIDVELARVKGAPEKLGYADYDFLIKQGLRARLVVQNFITGQLMLALDFYPDTEAKIYGIVKEYPELPTLPISPDIFEVMDEIPVKEIAEDLRETVAGINKLINLEGFYTLNIAIREVTEAARNIRLLTEYLEQHPEAILKGKQMPKGE